MELLFDRSSPLHAVAVVVLLASGLLCAWIGVRVGLLRGRRATDPVFTGRRARAIAALYLAAGLAGIAGAGFFLLRGR